MKLNKKILTTLAGLWLSLVILEGGSWVLLKTLFNQPGAPSKVEQYKAGLVIAGPVGYLGHHVANPMFGTQANPDNAPTNIYGLETRRYLPYIKNQNEFVIGVFGGSVANHLGRFLENDVETQELFSKKLTNGSQRIIFINLALPSLKQPQSYMLASHFGRYLDIGITVEGFNEILSEINPDIPEEYPTLTTAFYFREFNPHSLWPVKTLSYIRSAVTTLPLKVGLLAHSSFYHLFWRAVFQFTTRDIASLERDRIYTSKMNLPHLNKRYIDERTARRFELFEQYTFLQSVVMKSMKKKDFHFLQPSPLLRHSKSFSEQERALLVKEPELKTIQDYQKMQSDFKAWNGKGIAAFDLTGIYKDVKETVYIDSDCHVNNLGNKIMAAAILNSITR